MLRVPNTNQFEVPRDVAAQLRQERALGGASIAVVPITGILDNIGLTGRGLFKLLSSGIFEKNDPGGRHIGHCCFRGIANCHNKCFP